MRSLPFIEPKGLPKEDIVASMAINTQSGYYNSDENFDLGRRNCESVIIENIPNEKFQLIPLSLKESEAKDFLIDYTTNLEINIRRSYPQPQNIIMLVHNSSEDYWLTTPKNTALGIFCIENPRKRDKAMILHASTIKSEEFPTMLIQLEDYIWKTTNVTEIRVELEYIQNGKNYSAYNQLASLYYANGFKWKMVLNNPNKSYGRRSLVLGISRPDIMKLNKSVKSSLELHHYSILGLNNKPSTNSDNILKLSQSFYAPCSIIKAFQYLSQIDNFITQTDDDKISMSINAIISMRNKIKLYETQGMISELGSESIKHMIRQDNIKIDNKLVL